jgi:hypothetical protein
LFISISCLEMTINSFLLPGVEVHIFLKCWFGRLKAYMETK